MPWGQSAPPDVVGAGYGGTTHGTLTLEPNGVTLYVEAGTNENDAQPLSGSPFSATVSVINQVIGKKYFHVSENTHRITGTFKYAGQLNQERDSYGIYHYSDSYFDADARTINNPHLATMSLCLELSSWSSFDVSDKEGWNPAERTQNAAALLTDIGFENFKWSKDWNNYPQMNSMGAVAAYRNIPGTDTTVIALAIRGGTYYDEWGGNFYLGLDGDHKGFEKGRDTILTFLDEYIQENNGGNKEGFKSNVKIWIVGYSRGGAVANMVAGVLTDGTPCGGMKFLPQDIFAYTFEAPQGYSGNNVGYRNIKNYVFSYDLVPLVAPSEWGFKRYNDHDNLILAPTIVTKDYEKNTASMKKQYEKVLTGVPNYDGQMAEYKIYPFAKNFIPSIDIIYEWSWLWSVSPSLGLLDSIDIDISWSIPKETPIHTMMDDTMSLLFNNISNGRVGYVSSVESGLTQAISHLFGFGKHIDVIELLKQIFVVEDYAGTKQFIACIFDPTLTYSERIEKGHMVLRTRLLDAAEKQSYVLDEKLADDILSATGELLQALITSGGSDLNLLISFGDYLFSSNFQCHWPEIILAWMMSADTYYDGTNSFAIDYPEAFRLVTIKCPVDVIVRDQTGKEIASIKDGVIDNSGLSEAHGCSITDAGAKQVVLPADANYSIEIIGTDTGEMDYSVYEYNLRDRQYSLLQSYQSMPLTEGCIYLGLIPQFSKEDYFDAESDGSTIYYRLIMPDGSDAQPSINLNGDEITYSNVTVSTNNNRGVAIGSGSRVIHSQTLVQAACMPTVEFLGWYQNGQLVSTDLNYSFEVTSDVELVAHFSEGDYHTLAVTCTEGGQIVEDSCELPSGLEITMEAKALDGYEFVAWECTEGSFSDSGKIKTVFTMPSADTTVTAVFRRTVLPPEETPDGIFTATDVYAGILNNVTPGMKYSVDGGTTWNEITEDGMVITGVTEGNDIMLYMPGNGTTTTDSEIQTIDVTQADTPTLVAYQPTTINGTGSIPTDASHEYSVDGINWISCTGSMTELVPGTYYVRVRAAGTILASEAQQITIFAVNVAQVPVIDRQPESSNYTINERPSAMIVGVSTNDGGTLSYQWYSSTSSGYEHGTAIPGANTPSYLPSTNELGTTYYYCVITNTNGENDAYAISQIAQIVVREATVPPQTGDGFPLLLCLLLNAMAITVFCAQHRKIRRGNK